MNLNMQNIEPLVNKVANSGLITIDLEDFWSNEPVIVFDLKHYLVKGLVLMEKPFREALQQIDWQQYQNKQVAITCSTDALITMWAYMLVATKLTPYTQQLYFGNEQEAHVKILLQNITKALNDEKYQDAKVILKGCGKKPVPAEAYFLASELLGRKVRSLMFGEACSSVPVFKKPITK